MQAVGFDLDDTLAVTTRDRTALLRAATDRVDAPPIGREEYLCAHAEHSGGDTREPVFDALLEDDPDPADPVDLTSAYREVVEDALEPLPGAAGMIADLRADYRVGLLTDGPGEAQRSKLERLGWSDLFDAVVVTGDLPAPKPDPRPFRALADALDVPADRVVYVGNHPENDVQGSADAGMIPVQVTYENGPDPHPAAAVAVPRDRLVDELPGILADL